MRKTTIVSMICLLIGSVAMAESGEKRTEHFWQTGGGMHAVRGDYTYHSATGEAEVGGNRMDALSWGKVLGVSYEYGLTPDWALGVALNYGQNDVQVATKSGSRSSYNGNSGLGDVVIYGHNTTPMGSWNLHYGADLNYSLGKAKTSNVEYEGTMQSGGYGLRPYAGVSSDLGFGMIGAGVGYWWKNTRAVDVQTRNTDSKLKGGDIVDVSAFYEFHADMWLVDLTLGAKMIAEDKLTTTNNTSGVSTDAKAEARTVTSVGVGGQYYFAPTAMVRVGYTMEMLPEYKFDKDNNGKYYAANNNIFNIAARYEF